MPSLEKQRERAFARAVRRVARRNFYRTFYRDWNGDPSRSIMVAGTGRSGTTWLGELIVSQLACRMMFEPFHPGKVSQYRQFNYFQYLRPEQDCPPMSAFCDEVFTGRIRNRWIDRQANRLRPAYRLIKEVRANLLLGWISRRYPRVPRLFIIRHPCAVVHSRLRLNWATDGDLEPMLAQPDLVADFLEDKLGLIEATRTEAGKHALVWCISNLVPLREPTGEALTVVYYEHLRSHPQVEIPRIFRAIGKPYHESVFASLPKPSATTHADSRAANRARHADGWQAELAPAQIAEILAIVDAFGLSHHYGESARPLAPLSS